MSVLFLGSARDIEELLWSTLSSQARLALGHDCVRNQFRAELAAGFVEVSHQVVFDYYQLWLGLNDFIGLSNESSWKRFSAHLVHDGWDHIFQRCPVLLRLLIQVARDWISATREFLAAFVKDVELLAPHIDSLEGAIVKVSEPLSDRHNGGKTTRAVTIRGGKKFVYKPRSVKAESQFNELLNWIRPSLPDFCPSTFGVNQRNSYGWCDFVQCKSLYSRIELSSYYKKCGFLFSLAYFLNSRDLHHQNIIAAQDPTIVDLETVMSSESAPSTSSTKLETQSYDFSSSGLINTVRPISKNQQSMAGGFDTDTSYVAQRIRYKITNGRLSHAICNEVVPVFDNVPCESGKRTNISDFASDVTDGFEAMCKFALEKPMDLASAVAYFFSECQLRVVLLSTHAFHMTIQASLNTKCLSNEQIFQDRIRGVIRHASEYSRFEEPDLVVEAASRSLSRLDVPMHFQFANGLALRSETGDVIAEFRGPTPIESVSKRIVNFSNAKKDELKQSLSSVLTLNAG